MLHLLSFVWKSLAGREAGILHISWSERGGDDLWVWLASLLMGLLTYLLERLFLALKRNTDLFLWLQNWNGVIRKGPSHLKKLDLKRFVFVRDVWVCWANVTLLCICISSVLLDPAQGRTQHCWWRLFRSQSLFFFPFSLASNCSFITSEREADGGRLQIVNEVEEIDWLGLDLKSRRTNDRLC